MAKYSRTFRGTERSLESYLHVLDVHDEVDVHDGLEIHDCLDADVRDDLDAVDVHDGLEIHNYLDELDEADVRDELDEADVHDGLDITITVRSRPPVPGDALLKRLLNRLLRCT